MTQRTELELSAFEIGKVETLIADQLAQKENLSFFGDDSREAMQARQTLSILESRLADLYENHERLVAASQLQALASPGDKSDPAGH